MVPEGILSEDLYKIRSRLGDKKPQVDAEKKLSEVYGTRYRINLDRQILTGNVFSIHKPCTVTFYLKLPSHKPAKLSKDPTQLSLNTS